MSGGSFGYLCRKELEELVLDAAVETIRAMARALRNYDAGYDDAAAETDRVADLLAALPDDQKEQCAIDVVPDTEECRAIYGKVLALQPLWKAVEWHHSMDCGPDDVAAAVVAWRG